MPRLILGARMILSRVGCGILFVEAFSPAMSVKPKDLNL